MNSVRTRAIVLRRTNYGEADRIVQLLTPTGKKSVMARSVRKEKSRLAGGIELFAICDVVIGEGKGELGVLTSARLVQFYGNIMKDYDRMQFAYAVIKLVTKASEMVDEPDWYDIISEVLMGLDAHSIDPRLVQTWFYVHYAGVLGHELSLYHDTSGEKLTADDVYRYDETDQGFRKVQGGEIGAEHIKLLRLIATRPLATLAQIGGLDDILGDCLMIARQHAAI
jgi:DNA repair protein RecO (recombination protein O)